MLRNSCVVACSRCELQIDMDMRLDWKYPCARKLQERMYVTKSCVFLMLFKTCVGPISYKQICIFVLTAIKVDAWTASSDVCFEFASYNVAPRNVRVRNYSRFVDALWSIYIHTPIDLVNETKKHIDHIAAPRPSNRMWSQSLRMSNPREFGGMARG